MNANTIKSNGTSFDDFRPQIPEVWRDADFSSHAEAGSADSEDDKTVKLSQLDPIYVNPGAHSVESRAVGGARSATQYAIDFVLCALMVAGIAVACIDWGEVSLNWTMAGIGLAVALGAGRVAGYIHRNDIDVL